MSNKTDHTMPRERSPLAEIIAVGLPSAATMLSYPIMQLVDMRMLSELGPDAVAAQGNGGMAVWWLGSVVVGAMSVVNTFVAQQIGAGNPKRTSAYAWNGLWVCALAALCMLPMIPLMPAFFHLFDHGAEVHRQEIIYAQISLAGGFFMMSSRTIHQFFYGIHKPNVVLVTTIAAQGANVVFNYALIFGEFGMPALGIAGAAIGTVGATVIELVLPMALFLSPTYAERYDSRRHWKPNADRLRDLVRVGWPAGLMSGNEIFCWKIFMLKFVGEFGALHSAASWFSLRVMMLSFMPTVGISFGITAVVGRWIGKGDREEAGRRAMVGVGLCVAYMAVCALFMVIFREPLIRLFVTEEYTPEDAAEIVRIGGLVMICAAVFQIFDALGIALIGALRGAGDTVVPGVLNAVCAWVFLLGGGWFIVTQWPEMGSLGPWIAAAAFIIALGSALVWRWFSGAWKKIDIAAHAPAADDPVP